MTENINFIVVDDDFGTIRYCQIILKKTFPDADIRTFTNPEMGLEYLKNDYGAGKLKEAILLLDLNMPVMTGWEFLDEFQKLNEFIKKEIKIYIFSSSVDPHDKERAESNKNVSGYIVKPLTKQLLESIFVKQE